MFDRRCDVFFWTAADVTRHTASKMFHFCLIWHFPRCCLADVKRAFLLFLALELSLGGHFCTLGVNLVHQSLPRSFWTVPCFSYLWIMVQLKWFLDSAGLVVIRPECGLSSCTSRWKRVISVNSWFNKRGAQVGSNSFFSLSLLTSKII